MTRYQDLMKLTLSMADKYEKNNGCKLTSVEELYNDLQECLSDNNLVLTEIESAVIPSETVAPALDFEDYNKGPVEA